MKTCSQEVIILDLDTSEHGSSPSLATICDFLLLFFCFLLLFFCVFFGIEKTCFVIIRALLSAVLHVRRLAILCKCTCMK